MKFVPEDRIVLPAAFGNGVHFSDISQARGSKLARRLLKIKEVTGVFFGRDFVSVNKIEDVSWTSLRPIVLDAMMDAFAEADSKAASAGTASDEYGLVEDVQPSADTRITDDDDEVVAMIKELLETRIRPAVQEDGGDIFFMGFDEDSGIVKLKMAGSCVGCPSSTATLRNGVENMLMHYIPEVKGIEQVKAEYEKEGEKELRSLEQRLTSAGAEV